MVRKAFANDNLTYLIKENCRQFATSITNSIRFNSKYIFPNRYTNIF